MQLLQDGFRYPAGRNDAPPRDHFVAGEALLGHGWNVRELRQSCGGGHRECAHPLRLDERCDEEHGACLQRDLSADDIVMANEGRDMPLV